MKHVLCAFIACWKLRWTFTRIREQISENPRNSRGFSPALEFSQTLPRFSTGYRGTENMFYFLIIKLFSIYEREIRSAYVHFNFIPETVNSHNLETEATLSLTSFSWFIALWKHTCRPIKMHVLSKLFYNTYYNNYWRNSFKNVDCM